MKSEKKLSSEQKNFRRKWVVLFSALESLVQAGIKFTAALLTGSTALLADFFHSLTDVLGSFIVWIGVRMATYKSPRFPYGLYKIENLLALAIAFAILYVAYEIFLLFLTNQSVLPSNLYLGIFLVILGMSIDFFWGRFEAESGRLINSPGIEASGNHTLSDVYSSLVVLIGLIGAWLGYNLDRWAALIVALFIAKIGLEIFWDNVTALLDISIKNDKINSYKKLIKSQPGVLAVTKIRGRNAGSFRFINVSLALKYISIDKANSIVKSIQKKLLAMDDSIDSVFIDYEHSLPETINIFIPSDESGKTIHQHFGRASHFLRIVYNRSKLEVLSISTNVNQYAKNDHHRGISLAEYLINQGADSICCLENIHDKGPGLMFHRFGIEVRIANTDTVSLLLSDYLSYSNELFIENGLA